MLLCAGLQGWWQLSRRVLAFLHFCMGLLVNLWSRILGLHFVVCHYSPPIDVQLTSAARPVPPEKRKSSSALGSRLIACRFCSQPCWVNRRRWGGQSVLCLWIELAVSLHGVQSWQNSPAASRYQEDRVGSIIKQFQEPPLFNRSFLQHGRTMDIPAMRPRVHLRLRMRPHRCLGGNRSDFPVFRHLAVGHQYGHDDRHVPNGLSDPEHA